MKKLFKGSPPTSTVFQYTIQLQAKKVFNIQPDKDEVSSFRSSETDLDINILSVTSNVSIV